MNNDLVAYDKGVITTRANQADWSQYASISEIFNSDGFIDLHLILWGYEANKYIWIDPVMEVS